MYVYYSISKYMISISIYSNLNYSAINSSFQMLILCIVLVLTKGACWLYMYVYSATVSSLLSKQLAALETV